MKKWSVMGTMECTLIQSQARKEFNLEDKVIKTCWHDIHHVSHQVIEKDEDWLEVLKHHLRV